MKNTWSFVQRVCCFREVVLHLLTQTAQEEIQERLKPASTSLTHRQTRLDQQGFAHINHKFPNEKLAGGFTGCPAPALSPSAHVLPLSNLKMKEQKENTLCKKAFLALFFLPIPETNLQSPSQGCALFIQHPLLTHLCPGHLFYNVLKETAAKSPHLIPPHH